MLSTRVGGLTDKGREKRKGEGERKFFVSVFKVLRRRAATPGVFPSSLSPVLLDSAYSEYLLVSSTPDLTCRLVVLR